MPSACVKFLDSINAKACIMISDFEQKKKLQKRFLARREECGRRDVDFLSKLNEFLDRAMGSKRIMQFGRVSLQTF